MLTLRPSKKHKSTLSTSTHTLYSSTVLRGTYVAAGMTRLSLHSLTIPSSPYAGPAPISTPTGNEINCRYSTLAAANLLARDADPGADPATCTKVTVTRTVNAYCTETDYTYPGPVFVSAEGTLTTDVPSFCTTPGRNAKMGNGQGNTLTGLAYPYFPLNPVDCCVYCAQQITADLVSRWQTIHSPQSGGVDVLVAGEILLSSASKCKLTNRDRLQQRRL